MKKPINPGLFTAIKNSGQKRAIIIVKGMTWNPETDSLEDISFFYSYNHIVFQVDNIITDNNSDTELIYDFKKTNLLNFFSIKKIKEVQLIKEHQLESFFNPFCNINIWNREAAKFKRLMNSLLYPYLNDKKVYIERAIKGFKELGFKEFSDHLKDN